MNSEALEPRQAWFKCTAPATQRGYQLYSPAIEEAKIIFQRVIARKRKKKEENATEITPFRASSSKSKNEWLNPAQGSLLHPAGKRETGHGDFPLALPFIQHT